MEENSATWLVSGHLHGRKSSNFVDDRNERGDLGSTLVPIRQYLGTVGRPASHWVSFWNGRRVRPLAKRIFGESWERLPVDVLVRVFGVPYL